VPIYSEHVVLRGRRRELEHLDRLLRDVRGGQSRVLVLRGEAGSGKTALLDYLSGAASTGRVVRAAGVEPETEIAYSALQQLVAPLLDRLDRLPEPQRQALATGLGLASGPPPDALLIGLAVLGLFADAATEQPLICVVDDVQWLDRMSEVILTFVARRLDSESVALVFASRSPGDERILDGMPEMRVAGLAEADARALLDSVLPGPVDNRVRDRIVAETRGNPLALLELPRGLTAAELAFGVGSHGPSSLAGRVEEGFQRRIALLPADSRTLLLAAAVEPIGDVPLLWRALQRLGIGPDAAAPAEAAGLVEVGTRVRFRHPLVRSACWRSAEDAELRAVHAALAEATDPDTDPDRRAWHHAHAAIGPDEAVADELERCAGRALARGGRAAAAAFLQRAAELSPDPKPRAARVLAAASARLRSGQPSLVPELVDAAELGPLDPMQRAEAVRLRAQVAFALNPGRAAGPLLLEAARRLEDLDLVAARETYLTALGATLHAGRLGGEDARRVAAAARALAPGAEPQGLLLTGLATWVLDGLPAAAPLLKKALTACDEAGLLWLTIPVAHELWDDEFWHRITEQAVGFARTTGAMSLLPSALSLRAGALMYAGRFADASALLDEMDAYGRATRIPPDPSGPMSLLAFRGDAGPALELIDKVTRDATARSEGRTLNMADHVRAVLYNGSGRYPAALEAATRAAEYPDLGFYHWVLLEQIEAASRTGKPEIAAEARDRLAERTAAAGTEWALGAQALADALAGPAAQAEERYREAVERIPAGRLGLQVARARLMFGEWLRRENRRAEAREQLRSAHQAFLTMGAEGFAERAGRELTATGETVRKRVAHVPDELTAQESQIARLAVAGRTNVEIGAVLFLSPRTVEWHLRKVFTKLGIGSRRELAAALR
jgi:DNA-binding CsgD family transcriptional regulator